MVENRKFIRLRAPLPVEYRLIKKHKRQKTFTSVIKNISVGGLRLVLKEEARHGDLMEVRIRVPYLQEPVLLLGDVVWSVGSKNKDNVICEAGIRFQDANPLELNKILDFVYSAAIG